jgi:hypothetical protein
MAQRLPNRFSRSDVSLWLHGLVHFLDEVGGDLLFTAMLQVQEELSRSPPVPDQRTTFPLGSTS